MLSPGDLLFSRPNGCRLLRFHPHHVQSRICHLRGPRKCPPQVHIGTIGGNSWRIWSASGCRSHHKTYRRRSPLGQCVQAVAKIPIMAYPQSIPSVFPTCQQSLQDIHALLSHPSSTYLRYPESPELVTLRNEDQNSSASV